MFKNIQKMCSNATLLQKFSLWLFHLAVSVSVWQHSLSMLAPLLSVEPRAIDISFLTDAHLHFDRD
jgi:hypothetical protein